MMNDKLAKMLRHAAGYRNQSATPGTMPFPGVARFYRQPVASTRLTVKTCYVFMVDKYYKVQTKVLKLVVDRWGKAIMEMERCPPGSVPILHPITGKEIGRNKEEIVRLKETLVPASKPGRLNATQPKGIYRALKRMVRKGVLIDVYQALVQAKADGRLFEERRAMQAAAKADA